ncbi:hypothetical protein ESCO_002800 [Escovopsis weberi]|uniref:Nucleoporin NUP37 n=1 Tax=Escovopsis weberi TaxID=150374 RepID=A0A0M8N0J6_ESCWE|nr:hypothetical protein ESCO_002800 [Escovopsis weberi]
MGVPLVPRIRRTAQNTQFTYNLSRRVNDVQTYPVRSPQGASILIYGHENGVTVVWRGGRRLKAAKKQQQQAPPEKEQPSNGGADDVVMIIDSDDEEPPSSAAAPKFVDKPEFEDDVEMTPYPEIIQTLDLSLGAAVLHVAVMPLAPCSLDEAGSEGARVLGEKMVFAASCVTNDVYLITLPLTPPSPESKARPELRADLLAGRAGSGAWGETLLLLGGQRRHSEGLAINLVFPRPSEQSSRHPRVVVASHSRQASGALHLWDILLDKLASERPIEPFQTEFLLEPLTSISFNPSAATQLLTVSSPHAVRIYDFALPSSTPESEMAGPFPPQGSWLLSLYQPFARPSASRKPILDAVWISHGRAVFALLADGMWGIWDIDGGSPLQSGAVISNKLKSGIQGAALTAFSVSGYVEGTSSLRSVGTQSKEGQSGDFAPMTPHTRRHAAHTLSAVAQFDRMATVRGGIKVIALPSSGKTLQDESLILWVSGLEHVCVIPGVSRFWDSQLRKGAGGGVNLFSGAQPTRMVKLLDLSTGLLGDRCCGVGLIADPPRQNDGNADEGGLPVDIVILGESRLVIVREGEDGPGRKIGDVVLARKQRLVPRGEKSEAIIVHGRPEKPSSMSFNLSVAKPGTLRAKPAPELHDGAERADDSLLSAPSRPRLGFDFTSTMSAAADASVDSAGRDVEAEMLDIMEIDQALSMLDEKRGSGRKKVFFEED